ncbi:MAG TPA: alpha/beta fold hydrolase [Ilumatobacteraceae bacterium]|nr:alpha/beta fold hydrolase [Ilumatobacteraceae bacterium]
MIVTDAARPYESLESSLTRRLRELGVVDVDVVTGELPLTPRGDAGLQVVMVGVSAGDHAVRLAASDRRVVALALVVEPAHSAFGIELIGESPNTAILTVADPRRSSLDSALDGHLASSHDESEIWIGPVEDPTLGARIAAWLAERVASSAVSEEIAFGSTEGWLLHGDLVVARRGTPGPAVVLMHSARSDRSVFGRLSRLLAKRGFTVLNMDWRGRGRSTNKGRFSDLSDEQRAATSDDVNAAFDVVAALPEVDPARLGVLGIAQGAGYAAGGALGDPRTRALVLLTGFHAADERQRRLLVSGEVPVLYITGTPHRVTTEAMRSLYEQTRPGLTRFVEYPEGVLGYQLFDLHPDLEPLIVGWFAEVLVP